MRYRTDFPSQDITLYEGKIAITPSDQSEPLIADGKVWFKWEPSPRPYFGIATNDPRLVFADEATLELQPAGVRLTSNNVNIGGAGEFPVHGPTEVIGFGPRPHALTKMTFHLTNFANFHGGVLEIAVADWRITIKPVEKLSALVSELRYRGGFGITHEGEIERRDGGTFGADDVNELLTFLFVLLSFARGLWTGPILPIGWDQDGNVAWQSWRDWKLGRWRIMPTWFDDLIPGSIPAIAPELWSRWEGPQWHRAVQTLVSSLVETNSTPSTEVRLLVIQTTLELLSWMLLVETAAVYQKDAFDKRSAADKIRALLSSYGVGHDIPSELGHLSALAQARGYRDGPDACTQLRNGLVHPHEKGRRRVETLLVNEKFEAAQLLHWYAEVIFLKDLGYTGKYGNRLKLPRHVGDVDDLP